MPLVNARFIGLLVSPEFDTPVAPRQFVDRLRTGYCQPLGKRARGGGD